MYLGKSTRPDNPDRIFRCIHPRGGVGWVPSFLSKINMFSWCFFVCLLSLKARENVVTWYFYIFHVQRNEDIQKPMAESKHKTWPFMAGLWHGSHDIKRNLTSLTSCVKGNSSWLKNSTSINLFPIRPHHRPKMHLARVGLLGGALYFHPYVITCQYTEFLMSFSFFLKWPWPL